MWINRTLYDVLTRERAEALQDARVLQAEVSKLFQEQRSLIHENAAHKTTLDWARVRINHLERQFASVLYSKTGIEMPMPKIEAAPTEQSNPNMLPDFGHVEDDDPAFKAHPDWFSTGPEPFPLEESKK